MTYKLVEFEHWYEIQKILNDEQPDKWTVIVMPTGGNLGTSGKIVLEYASK